MGLLDKVQSLDIDKRAQQAADQGRSIFVANFSQASTTARNMERWAEMIEAVESVGWALQHFAVHDGPSGKAEAYCVFRRRV